MQDDEDMYGTFTKEEAGAKGFVPYDNGGDPMKGSEPHVGVEIVDLSANNREGV